MHASIHTWGSGVRDTKHTSIAHQYMETVHADRRGDTTHITCRHTLILAFLLLKLMCEFPEEKKKKYN